MKRRGFLKFIAGGVTGLVASPIIWNSLYDAVYWTQNWGWIPRLQKGLDKYAPTVSKLCPSGTGIKVRLTGGRPVRALGNPDNQFSQGCLTAIAAAETQMLYSEARLKHPLRRTSDGAYVQIGWDEAHKLLLEKFTEAASSVAGVSGDPTSFINEIFSALLTERGSGDFYYMPGDEMAAAHAWKAMGGVGRIGYDLENSDFILSVGANLLESWGVVARNRRVFNAGRPIGEEPKLKLAYAGPVQNNTAVAADQWLALRPGSEIGLLLGLINLFIQAGNFKDLPGIYELAALAEDYTPEKVAAQTGIAPDRLRSLADNLGKAKSPLIIVGSELGAGGGAVPVMLGIALNMLLSPDNLTGNLRDLPYPPKFIPQASGYGQIMGKDFVRFCKNAAKGSAPKLLLIYDANPLYSLPKDSGFADLMNKSGFKVIITSFMSETCKAADLILPQALGLERFDDVYTPYGSGVENYAIAQPITTPAYSARPMAEFMLGLASDLGCSFAITDVPHLLERRASLLNASFRQMLDTGEVCISGRTAGFAVPTFNTEIIKANLGFAGAGTIYAAPVTILGMGTPQTGIPPLATKIIADYQLKGQYSVAQMNAATAAKLNVRKGSRLKLSNAANTVTVLVDIFEGVHPDVIALTTGLGHTEFDAFSQNKGINYMTLASVSQEPGTDLWVWGCPGVSAAKA